MLSVLFEWGFREFLESVKSISRKFKALFQLSFSDTFRDVPSGVSRMFKECFRVV